MMISGRGSVLLLMGALLLLAGDVAIVGTWSLRIARSDMRPSEVVSETAAITQKDAVTLHYVYDFEFKDGHRTHREQDRVFDGREVAVADGAVEVGTHPDANTWISRRLKNGRLTNEFHSTISADGKTQTVKRTTVTTAETVRESIVFERQ